MAAVAQNERLAAALRVVVAGAALAIFLADPSEHPERRPFATGVLALFTVYSALSYLIGLRRGRSVGTLTAPWIDVAWVTLAVAVSQGTSGIFYPLYLFPIVCASFWGGFRQGFSIAAVSALAFAIVGPITAPRGVDLRHFSISSLYLLVLGYLTAVWGGHEIRSRARLALLREVTSLPSPGLEPAVERFLESVRAFFGARSCSMIVHDTRSGEHWMRAAHGHGPQAKVITLPPHVAADLLPPPDDASFLLRRRGRRRIGFTLVDGASPGEGDPKVGAALLTELEAGALLSIPFRYHATAQGRVYVARARRAFDRTDVEFLRLVVDQLVSVLDNLRLVDRLALEAATEERRRIALDLHDSVIQPYLGLRLGLSAALASLAGGRIAEAKEHVGRLVQLADGEVQTLRGYVRELRTDLAVDAAGLEPSIRQLCHRFADATGIHVEVAAAPLQVQDHVAPEIFQMVAEGLSNVRRHTRATRADVHIEAPEGLVRLTITNDAAPAFPIAFSPRSLAERAGALGGTVHVEHADGSTTIRVDIPVKQSVTSP